MPSRGAEIVDVCFILDLTGSMGRWIDQCKTHVSNVIRGLKADLAATRERLASLLARAAVVANPRDARRWSDLGLALDALAALPFEFAFGIANMNEPNTIPSGG